jgi:electron transfer flavoprotein alpha subunit
MSKILIIAEHDGGSLNVSTARTVSCAAAIGGHIDVAVLGHGIDGVAGEAAALEGVSQVLAVDADHLAAPLAANFAPELAAMADEYSHVLAPSTTFGKDILPRVAALLGVNQVSDIMSVEGPRQFKRRSPKA